MKNCDYPNWGERSDWCGIHNQNPLLCMTEDRKELTLQIEGTKKSFSEILYTSIRGDILVDDKNDKRGRILSKIYEIAGAAMGDCEPPERSVVKEYSDEMDRLNRLYSDLKKEFDALLTAVLDERKRGDGLFVTTVAALEKAQTFAENRVELAHLVSLSAELCCPTCKVARCVQPRDDNRYWCDYCKLTFEPVK